MGTLTFFFDAKNNPSLHSPDAPQNLPGLYLTRIQLLDVTSTMSLPGLCLTRMELLDVTSTMSNYHLPTKLIMSSYI